VVDGVDSTNQNHTSGTVLGASSAVLNVSIAQPLYMRVDTSGDSSLYTADDAAFGGSCNNTDPFTDGELIDGPTTTPSMLSAAALADASGNYVWTAYTDMDGNLYAGEGAYQKGPQTAPMLFPFTNLGAVGTPAIVIFGGQTWVFYTQAAPGYNQIAYVTSTDGTTWTTPVYLVGSSKQAAQDPTAVVFNGSLWLFYWLPFAGCLGGMSYDGSSWSGSSFIDGLGGNNGQTLDNVGKFPKAIVETSLTPNRMFVFYQDYSVSGGALRASWMIAGNSTWIAQTPDSPVTMDSPPAPVIHGGTVHVYYIDTANHKVKGTWQTLKSWQTPETVDGGSSNNCGANGGTSSPLGGPIAAVERPGCGGTASAPHVFYANIDTNHRDLREGYVIE
jgi:hypothetical protein